MSEEMIPDVEMTSDVPEKKSLAELVKQFEELVQNEDRMKMSKEAEAIKAAVPCKRVGVAVLGMEVPHTHIHLVPLNVEADMDFRKPKLELSQEEFSAVASAIYEEYVKIQ